jgi:hypothetical protein
MNELDRNVKMSNLMGNAMYTDFVSKQPLDQHKELALYFDWDTGMKHTIATDENDVVTLVRSEPDETINEVKNKVTNGEELEPGFLEKMGNMVKGVAKWSMSSTKKDWYTAISKAGFAFSDTLEQGSNLITGGNIKTIFEDQPRIFRMINPDTGSDISLKVSNRDIKNNFSDMMPEFQPGAKYHPFDQDGKLKEGWQEISTSVFESDKMKYETEAFTPAALTEYLIQYGAPGMGIYQYLGKVDKLRKMPFTRIILAELGVEFLGATQKKDDINLANLLQNFGVFENPDTVANFMREAIAADMDDTVFERKVKNMVGNAPFGVAIGSTVEGVRIASQIFKTMKKLKYNKEGREILADINGYSISKNPETNGDFSVSDKNGVVLASFKTQEEADQFAATSPGNLEAKSLSAAATPEEQKKNFTYQGFKVDPETDEFKLQQGLPKNVKTKEDLSNLKNQVDTLTVEGDAGKFWYEKSGQKILQSVQGDKLEAEKIIKLIALYSPNAAPTPNTAAALKAYYQFLDGKPINAGMGALDKKATALLYEGKDFAGYKVNNFYNNLMMEVDPSKVNKEAITTDRWILRAFDYETTGNPTQPQINFIETTINEVAEQRNLTPYQVQAAIWASIRAGRDPKKIAELAGDDFELAINKNLGQISWETAPGAKYNFFPEYQSADASVKAEYHFDLTKAISDDSGVDLIAKRLGLITPDQFNTAGVYQNSLGELEFNPGTQTQFVAPVATGSGNVTLKGGFEARSAIDPSAKEIIEAYSYIKGKLLNQEAVAYHRPVYNAQKQLSNGLEIKYDLSNDELKNLTIALNEEFSNFPGFVVPIGSPDGFRLIINPDVTGYSITDFQTKAYNAINKTINVEDKDVIAFSTNSGYVDIDDYKFEKFESGSEEPSDLYRKISSILSELQPRVEEVYKKYETEYGWTR